MAVNPSRTQLALLWTFLIGPFFALALAVTLAAGAGVGPTWLDAGLAVLFYVIAGHGVTVGFHRYFTHRAFTAKRPLRIALAVAGSMAVEGSVTSWVADHRRHHAHSDAPGDPHSPWRFGPGGWNLTKGLWWAHMGWLFADEETNRERFAPDLLADRGVTRVNALFPMWILISILAPALLGGLITWSWSGALTAVLWAGLVRIFVLHHVTWSTNSVCHVVGSRPFESRDRATNVWPLAVLSMGESWHNLHHADPTCARHGVDRGQVDSSARLIRWMERLGWVTGVRWPDATRLSQRRVSALVPAGRPSGSGAAVEDPHLDGLLTSTLQDRYREVPFLPDATYYFIAVTVATRRSAPHIRSWFADV